MPSAAAHVERHLSHRVGWLRAAVLGANDGITSTASLIVGVAAAGASRNAVFTAGVAALVAGAGSMAAGEYSSVSSQRDSELADIAKERLELETTPERELRELTRIYIDKGLNPGPGPRGRRRALQGRRAGRAHGRGARHHPRHHGPPGCRPRSTRRCRSRPAR